MQTILIATQKGGAGKTTLAANLGIAAWQAGKKVVMLDLDPQQSLHAWLGDREGEGPEMLDQNPKWEQVAPLLQGLSGHYDLCIIDTPPVDFTRLAELAPHVSLTLIPTKASPPDLRAIRAMVPTLMTTRIPFAFTISDAVHRSADAGDALKALATVGRVSPAVFHSRVSYSRAMGQGLGAAEMGDAKAAAEIASMWDYVQEILSYER